MSDDKKKVRFFLGLGLMMAFVFYSAIRQQQMMAYEYIILSLLIVAALVFDYVKVGRFLALTKQYEQAHCSHERAIQTALASTVKSPLVLRLIETELLTLYYAFFAKHELSGIVHKATRFSYVKSSNAHDLFLFVALSQLPFLPFIHVFVEYKKGPGIAWAISTLTLWSVVWYLAQVEAVKYRPIEVSYGELKYRFGIFWMANIPLEQIRTARAIDVAETLQGGDLFMSPLGSKRNVILEFAEPVRFRGPYMLGRRKRRAAISLDDPAGFLRQLELRGVATSLNTVHAAGYKRTRNNHG